MRSMIPILLVLAASALFACKGGEGPSAAAGAPNDPKSLYTVEASAGPVESGGSSTLFLAIRPIEGAEVKEETPFRGKLTAAGPIELGTTEFGYVDHARVEGQGPVFELPFEGRAAGEGSIEADLTFFVCKEDACLRTTEKISIPVQVN